MDNSERRSGLSRHNKGMMRRSGNRASRLVFRILRLSGFLVVVMAAVTYGPGENVHETECHA